jgi:DNA uptake protein ComE-like DNA-binding protein/outer membrane murein-binding lipoprotein Lpp
LTFGSLGAAETIVFDVGECMKEQIVRGLMALVLVGMPGCVSQGTYDQTLKDLQSTKSDLDRLRIQNEALNKQVIGLKESNARHREELDRTNAQIALLKEEVSKERQATDNKVKDLDRQVKELMKVKKDLTQELEVQKQRYEDSLKTIKRQAKELKEREKSALIEPPTPQAKPTAPPADATKPPEAPSPVPSEVVPPAPAVPASPSNQDAKVPTNLVDINKATSVDLILTLGLDKEDTDKLVKNRPYKTIEELVTRAGIAKATVDKIREKVTVGP